jgi:hypothetical protein
MEHISSMDVILTATIESQTFFFFGGKHETQDLRKHRRASFDFTTK